MTKRKKKKRKSTNSLSPQARELRAQKHISTGRFRQAVNDCKSLMKIDPEAYVPILRSAYKGLYRQRLDKGMLAEAGMVLEQLKKLPGDTLCVEHLWLLFKQGAFAKAAMEAAKVLAGDAKISGQDAALAADALVTSFEDIAPSLALPDPVGDHLQRIQTALKAVTDQKYPEALSAIKVIGLRSIFFSWKCLIKGYCAFYNHEDVKALAAFKMIAAGTVPKAAAAPYEGLLSNPPGGNGEGRDPGLLESECIVAGYPEIAPALSRAEYLWQVKRYRDSYTHMLDKVENFPTLSQGLERTLTELYYNISFELPVEAAEKYIKKLIRAANDKRRGNSLAQFWASRSVALFFESHAFEDEILDQWEHFLELPSSPYSGLPKVQALVYGRLGDLFSQEVPYANPFSFFFNRRRRKQVEFRDPELARHCYEKSLEADPDSKETQLAMIAFLEKSNDSAAVNRLLDQMIKQFPDEKAVLFKAGVRCIERKAFVKAMNYLEKALALDPTDRTARETYILACIRAAHNYALKGKTEKSRNLLPCVIPIADPKSDHFNYGCAYLYARWTAFEQLAGNDAEADRIWQQALDNPPAGEFKVTIFYWVVAQYYRVPSRYLKKIYAYIQKALKGPADATIAAALADTLLYAQQFPEPIFGRLDSKIAKFDKYIFKAAGTEMTRPLAKAIMAYARSDECEHPKIAKRCVDNMLKRHPEDAYFQYHLYLERLQKKGYGHGIQKSIRELETILQLAKAQKEAQITVAAQKLLNELESFKNQEMMDDSAFDLPYDFGENHDDQNLEMLMDLFDGLNRSIEGDKKPSKANKKPKPKGPEQLKLF